MFPLCPDPPAHLSLISNHWNVSTHHHTCSPFASFTRLYKYQPSSPNQMPGCCRFGCTCGSSITDAVCGVVSVAPVCDRTTRRVTYILLVSSGMKVMLNVKWKKDLEKYFLF